MSKFLEFPSYIVDIGKSAVNWKDELKAHLTRNNWRVIAEADAPNIFLDVMPPATETIGAGVFSEVVRFEITNTETRMRTYLRGNFEGYPAYRLEMPSYAYENAVTINGVKITTGVYTDYYKKPRDRATDWANVLRNYRTANPSSDLAKFRFELITDAANPDIGAVNIYTDAATPALTFTAPTNVPVAQIEARYTANSPASFSDVFTLTHDLVSGFVYFLSIHTRKIELAIKTSAAYFGPIGVQYVENAVAVAATPSGLAPIEAVLYGTGANTGTAHNYPARLSHIWAIVDSNNSGEFNGRHADSFSQRALYPDKRPRNRRTNTNSQPEASLMGLERNFSFKALPAGVTGAALGLRPMVEQDQSVCLFNTPGLRLDDVFAITVAGTNESLYLGKIETASSALIGITSAGLEVFDAAAFPAAGVVVVEAELIKYAGKAGNVLTGLTRAAYATAEVPHGAGVPVFPCMWFVKINNGMMTAGYVKPGAA